MKISPYFFPSCLLTDRPVCLITEQETIATVMIVNVSISLEGGVEFEGIDEGGNGLTGRYLFNTLTEAENVLESMRNGEPHEDENVSWSRVDLPTHEVQSLVLYRDCEDSDAEPARIGVVDGVQVVFDCQEQGSLGVIVIYEVVEQFTKNVHMVPAENIVTAA